MPRRTGDIYGRRWSGDYRLRPTLLGVRIERRVEDADGSVRWVSWPHPVNITLKG